MISGYLTKRSNGLWLFTEHPPVIVAVGSSEVIDAYPIPGDSIAYNNMCPRSVEMIWGINPKEHRRLESIRVRLVGTVTE